METRAIRHTIGTWRKAGRGEGRKTEDMDTRLVTRITRDRARHVARSQWEPEACCRTRHYKRRTGSNFKKSHGGNRKSRWNGDAPLENWVTTYGLCWSFLSPISRIVFHIRRRDVPSASQVKSNARDFVTLARNIDRSRSRRIRHISRRNGLPLIKEVYLHFYDTQGTTYSLIYSLSSRRIVKNSHTLLHYLCYNNK